MPWLYTKLICFDCDAQISRKLHYMPAYYSYLAHTLFIRNILEPGRNALCRIYSNLYIMEIKGVFSSMLTLWLCQGIQLIIKVCVLDLLQLLSDDFSFHFHNQSEINSENNTKLGHLNNIQYTDFKVNSLQTIKLQRAHCLQIFLLLSVSLI